MLNLLLVPQLIFFQLFKTLYYEKKLNRYKRSCLIQLDSLHAVLSIHQFSFVYSLLDFRTALTELYVETVFPHEYEYIEHSG